jgi:ubiquinone biosynthesis protein UbiJ
VLRFDPDTAIKFARMQGKVFKLELQVADRALFLIPAEDGIRVRDEWPGEADVSLRGSPLAFVQYALRQKYTGNRLFVDKKITIEGDAEMAQDFQKLLREMDIDFEELLSHYIGDVAAHQAGRGLRRLRDWAKEAVESMRLDVREYLVEEIRVLAPEWRVAAFIDETDVLRADVERLEQRVERLGSRLE